MKKILTLTTEQEKMFEELRSLMGLRDSAIFGMALFDFYKKSFGPSVLPKSSSRSETRPVGRPSKLPEDKKIQELQKFIDDSLKEEGEFTSPIGIQMWLKVKFGPASFKEKAPEDSLACLCFYKREGETDFDEFPSQSECFVPEMKYADFKNLVADGKIKVPEDKMSS